jgi:hypothetical protein
MASVKDARCGQARDSKVKGKDSTYALGKVCTYIDGKPKLCFIDGL